MESGGTVVHKFAVFREPDFIAAVTDGLDPTKQFYRQMERYERGDRDVDLMRSLARTARTFGDKETMRQVVADFIRQVNDSDLYTKDNLRFLASVTEQASDPGFRIFLENDERIGRVLGDEFYADNIIDRIIRTKEIDPIAFPARRPSADTPPWERMHADIASMYGDRHADRSVLLARVRWFALKRWNGTEKPNWREFEQHALAAFERYGPRITMGERNLISWRLFMCSTNPDLLNLAAKMMEPVTRDSAATGILWAAMVDTYANALFKAGRRDEAIKWQAKAAAAAPADSGFRRTMAKMEAGEPTWDGASCQPRASFRRGTGTYVAVPFTQNARSALRSGRNVTAVQVRLPQRFQYINPGIEDTPAAVVAADGQRPLSAAGQNSAGSTSSAGAVAAGATGGELVLDFSAHGGTIKDAGGAGTGFTTRLPGSGSNHPTNDPNLQIDTFGGTLNITTTRVDFNGQRNMADAEAIGVSLRSLGYTGKEDFSISSIFPNIPGNDVLDIPDQLGLFVGTSTTSMIRAGLLNLDRYAQGSTRSNLAFATITEGTQDANSR